MTFAWWNLAECRGAGTDLFFEPENFPEADKLCQVCPARNACRDMALAKTAEMVAAGEQDLDFGFFASMTPKMRLHAVLEASQYSETDR